MKLLILSNNLQRASFRQRIGSHIPRLEGVGIECFVRQLPRQFISRRRIFRQARDYDGVLLHKKTLTRLDAWVLRNRARVLIYDFDDAIMYSATRPDRRWSSHYGRFRRTVGLMDGIIAGNAYLAQRAQRFNRHVRVLPTGMDVPVDSGTVRKPSDGKIRLTWIGSRSTLRYVEPLQPVLQELGQRHPKLVLRIICDAFPAFAGIDVERRVWSLETQTTDLAECDIGLAPLPDNRFTRGKCGFKILQYAAAGLPTVGSPVGVNADFIGSPQRGLTAVTPKQWAGALTGLIQDAGIRRDMGRAARQFSQQFDLARVGKAFVEIVQQTLDR